MSDLLSIGRSAVSAYQNALGTVSNNIANLTNPAYSRQELALSQGPQQKVGSVYLGTGVLFDGVRRAYDAFAEAGLRTSHSALETHGPMIEYANRVVDVTGNAQSGLAPALDGFFASARALAADPASSDARGLYLRSADGVATRLRELSGQLDSIEADSRGALNESLGSLNTLARQLAAVNAQLRHEIDAANQPPALLDQRDQLLRDMAKLARLTVTTAKNGEATVALGASRAQPALVSGGLARTLGAFFSDSATGKVDIVLDPNGTPVSVAGIDSGRIAGLIAFRQQVLEPAQNRLDLVARTFAQEVNAVQSAGVDARGRQGAALFGIDPLFRAESPAGGQAVDVNATVVDAARFAFHDVRLQYDAQNRRWTGTDTVTGQSASGSRDLTLNGIRIELSGQARDAETVILKASQRPAATIRSVLEDSAGIACGSLFRAIAGPANTGGARASVAYAPPAGARPGPLPLDRLLVNNPHPSAGVSFINSAGASMSAVATVPAGFGDLALYLAAPAPATLDLQVFTRDGQHLLGTPLDRQQQLALVNTANGFTAGAGYSADYLGGAGTPAYKDLQLFYGARAVPGGDPAFDARNRLTDDRLLLARLESSAIPVSNAAPGSTLIGAGALTLNGRPMTALVVPAGGLQAGDIAAWINSQAPVGAGVTARAANTLRIDAAALNVTGSPDPSRAAQAVNASLSINSVEIVRPAAGFADAQSLVDAINTQSAGSGVAATLDRDGAITLRNTAGNEGRDISIGTPTGSAPGQPPLFTANVLDMAPATLRGRIEITSPAEVRIGIGTNGSTADLARLGLRAAAFADGTPGEDLLVFATGVGTGSLAAAYRNATMDGLAYQRAATLQIEFTAADAYTITDVASGTLLARRAYDPQAGIDYRDLHISLAGTPRPGDRFRIDGNQDGAADNTNIRRIIELEVGRTPMPGGKTIGAAYQDLVSGAGMVAGQAKISQQAMSVVNQQAIATRDKASGVNLDDEAADLIRYQQAYQAAAKTIQVASQIFDTIAQIR